MRHISPRPEDVAPAASAAPLSMTDIQAHYRRGRELQAEAIGAFFSRLFGRDAEAPGRRADRAVAAPSIVQALARSLTTVRTTSELLRDHPEIGRRATIATALRPRSCSPGCPRRRPVPSIHRPDPPDCTPPAR